MASPDLIGLLTNLERHVAAASDRRTRTAAARDHADLIMVHLHEIIDYLDHTSPRDLFYHLNEINASQTGLGLTSSPLLTRNQIPASNNLRDKLYLLNTWLTSRGQFGSANTSLSDLANQIGTLNTNRSDLGTPGQRAGAAAEFLNNCLTAPITTPASIAASNAPRWDAAGNRITATVLNDPNSGNPLSDNTLTKQFRYVSSGGTQGSDDYLDQLADEATNFLYEFAQALDPRNPDSLMASMLGEDAGNVASSAPSPDSTFANIRNLDSYTPSLEGAYDKGSVVGAITETLKKKTWGADNSGFGLAPNLQLLNRASQWARFNDQQYQQLERAFDRNAVAADRLHRHLHDLSGRLISQLGDKAGRTTFLELVRRIGERIESDPRFQMDFPETQFDIQSALSKVKASFNNPGYEAYLPLHLASCVHIPALEGITSKLLAVFDPSQAVRLREEYMMEPGPNGTPVFRPASLYSTLTIFNRAFGHKLAEAQQDVLAMPVNFPNEELAGKHYARTSMINDVLSMGRYTQFKVALTREQLERSMSYKEFALARMNPKVMKFLRKAVPALNIVTDPFFRTWNIAKKIPVVGWPFRFTEWLHKGTGETLSFVGSCFGLIPSFKKSIDKAWSFTSPVQLRNMANHSIGQFHQINACSGLLGSLVTPYFGAMDAMKRVLGGADPHSVDPVALEADLRNVYAFMESYVADSVKAERYGVGLNPTVAQRFGVPGLKMKKITDKNGNEQEIVDPDQYVASDRLLNHFRSQVHEFYNRTYATGGETRFEVEYTRVDAKNPRRFDGEPFGNYVLRGKDQLIVYSETYRGFDLKGNIVDITSNATPQQKQQARDLNKAAYEAQLKADEAFAASRNEDLRTKFAAVNALINSMRPKMRVFGHSIREAAAFSTTNTTEKQAGLGAKNTRDTPMTIHGPHKNAIAPFARSPLETKSDTVTFGNTTTPVEVVTSGPTLGNKMLSGPFGAKTLAVAGAGFRPSSAQNYFYGADGRG